MEGQNSNVERSSGQWTWSTTQDAMQDENDNATASSLMRTLSPHPTGAQAEAIEHDVSSRNAASIYVASRV